VHSNIASKLEKYTIKKPKEKKLKNSCPSLTWHKPFKLHHEKIYSSENPLKETKILQDIPTL
jgi:hypothetical protein